VTQVLRVARFRFRATFTHRWAGYLGLVILIALTGGLAMGAIAAGRRTRAAFPAFLASTNPSDLSAEFSGTGNSYDPIAITKVRNLAHVKHVEVFAVLDAGVINPDGSSATDPTRIAIAGSVDGALFDQDRFAVTQGRMANPDRANEVVVSQLVADTLGLHVGQTLTIGIITSDAPTPIPGKRVDLHQRIDATVVGIGKLNSEVVQDDVGRFPTYIVATPALTRSLLDCCVAWTWIGFQLDRGNADVATVEREYVATLAPDVGYQFRVAAQVTDQAQRAIEPEVIALIAFGAIAAAASLVIAGQAIGRQLRTNREDLDVLRALGADSTMITIDALPGIVGAIVLGALLAAGVAIAMSSFAPIGPVRAVDPSPGIAVDWTVIGAGAALLIVGLGGLAVAGAYRNAPHRIARRVGRRTERTSVGARAATASGLPVPAVVGIRFALEPGRGRTSVPVRSAIAGTALAVVLVVATVTFGNSLATLVSHPALYGWDWSYALESTDGYGPIPPLGQSMLDHDPNVAAWTGVYLGTIDIDGQAVPGIFGSTHAELTPPILRGHTFDTADQIVLGAATLAQLHKSLGDTVTLSYGNANGTFSPKQLRIVGTATMPAVGPLDGLHSSMGTGALLSSDVIPAAARDRFGAFSGPNMIFVRFRAGADSATAVKSLQQIADSVNKTMVANTATAGGASIYVLPVQHPAEIVNYRSMGATPTVLAAGLAAGAVAALGLTLTASVRRRRRDLALLKTLGFTRRQLASVVAWQASVAAVIGIVVGVPVGVVLGRWLWILFARQIFAVPQPIVPVWSVVLVAIGALVVANAMAALPGRRAARTPTALLLRAE
jgi:hypothetical protein